MKRHGYVDPLAESEPEKETEDLEPEWEWDEDPVREKIRKKKGKAEEAHRASRWRGGGKKKAR